MGGPELGLRSTRICACTFSRSLQLIVTFLRTATTSSRAIACNVGSPSTLLLISLKTRTAMDCEHCHQPIPRGEPIYRAYSRCPWAFQRLATGQVGTTSA